MTAPTASIRLVTAGDFAALAAITNHYIRHTAIHFGYEEVHADELQRLWREHEDLYPWLVATMDDAVIGYAKAGVFRARDAYRGITETGIYLAAEACGRGHGRPLYERLLATLRAQGFHTAIGGIALPNDVSVALHERLGFTAVGTVRQAGRKFDRWHDVGFWQLMLQGADAAPRSLRTPAAGFAAARDAE